MIRVKGDLGPGYNVNSSPAQAYAYMSDLRTAPEAEPALAAGTGAPNRDRRPATVLSEDTRIAIEIRELVGHGAIDAARERFADLVAIHQRRAMRIAYQYLRDAADADEVVQDALVKAYSHIDSYREAWPFEVWFTRILVNGCLDRRKARARRARWFVQTDTGQFGDEARPVLSGTAQDPEARLLARERRGRLAAAIERLDGRQRTIFMLTHYGDCNPREVGAVMGLKESTVRVHLFRAARKLRALLGGQR
jgi:RNA polymerase sigma-70 factor (ECF subfamily)